MKFTWGHGIIIFFIIFFTWIISFVVFTFSENNDLVTKDYYKQGAEYSKQIDINKRSAVFKDSVAIKNVNDAVQILLPSSIASLKTEKEVYFYRPSAEKDDKRLTIKQGEGALTIPKSELVLGRYIVSVSWFKDNQKYSISKDFRVR